MSPLPVAWEMNFARIAMRQLSVTLAAAMILVLTAQASTFTTLYSFHSPELLPIGGLVLASDGNYYGTTEYGGNYDSGTVFRMTPSGTVTQLATFNGTNGQYPEATLALGTDGNFYGTTNRGGTLGDGVVFRITPAGILTVLHSFSGSDGQYPMSALIIGRNGSFYGTTTGGGAFGYGTVFSLTLAGSLSVVYDYQNSAVEGYNPNGLVLGNDGNFYGTTAYGGSGSYGTVYRVTPTGVLTLLYSFTGISDGGIPYSRLTLGKDGNFYGTTTGVQAGNFGTIFKITTSGALTTLYSFTGGSDGSFPAAPLLQGSDGNFYGISSNGGTGQAGTIFRVTPSGTLTTLYEFYGLGTPAQYPSETVLGGLIEGADGNFYGCVPRLYNPVQNPDDGAVFRVTPKGTFTTLASFTTPSGEYPTGPVLGTDGNLYGTAVEGGAHNDGTFYRLTPQGKLTTLTAFSGTNGFMPESIVQGKDGDFYGTAHDGSMDSGRVFRVASGGKLVWQTLFNGTDGASTYTALFQASDGNFYGSTSKGGTSNSGSIFRVTTAGVLTSLYSFSGGADGSSPSSLSQDSLGNLYGTTAYGGTSGYGTVFKITTTGEFTSLYSFTGADDGGNPYVGLTLGSDGNFYGVTIFYGVNYAGTIFKITPSGLLTTLYPFSYTSGGILPDSVLVGGTNGILYGSTLGGGTGWGTLFSVTTSGQVTFLYSFTGTVGGSGPTFLYLSAGGDIYGTTSAEPGTIFEFTP
jgi:uncharacterized repeat protein (TIGR03803 family)